MPQKPPVPIRPQPNPQTLRDELLEYLANEGLSIFYCEPPVTPGAIWWDVQGRPDYRDFFAAAKGCEVKLIYFFDQSFEEENLERIEANLEVAMIPDDERRSLMRRLADFRGYVGFLCRLGAGFTQGDKMHWYEVCAPWFYEYLDLLSESKAMAGPFDLDDGLDDDDFEDDDDDEDDLPPFGGRYSRN